MQPLTQVLLVMGLLTGQQLLSDGAHANTYPTENTPAAVRTLSIQYDQGWISARIINIPLTEVCRELAQKTRSRCLLNDRSVEALQLSATFKGLPLREGIGKILTGFSYALYPSAETGELEINVLLARGPAPKNPAAAEGAASQAGTYMADNTPLLPASIAGVPQDLEESRPVEVKLDPETQSAREWEIQARQHEYQEGLLQRVREIMDSEQQHLHTEALALLQGMDDPRATEVLIAAALGRDEDSQARAQAVEILWRHAADLDYRDEASVNALKQLADDSDSLAAEVARQALDSIRPAQRCAIGESK